ncbi:unnamed protein product [Acanthoscelides obtectus]|uniref:Uncharacterized protein n=1 Tax=Acanthoscelides obtectus TaxID=200917 RepID=A0A9P0Q5E0_ACAOB|nr:unnamed protein product [Acanthoscelides obtectus]
MSNSTFIQYDNKKKKISLRIGELRSSEQSKDVLKFPRIPDDRVFLAIPWTFSNLATLGPPLKNDLKIATS